MRKLTHARAIMLLLSMIIALQVEAIAQTNIEHLGRGLIVTRAENKGNFVSWRYLATDSLPTTFDLLRNGDAIKTDISTSTSYTDTYGTSAHTYQIVTKINGEAIDTTDAVTPWTDYYWQIHLDLPTAKGYTYSPNDCSVGDVDGDGEYELFVKAYLTNTNTLLRPSNYKQYLDYQFICRREGYFDVAKEIVAIERKLKLGLSNPIIELEAQGFDVEEVLDGWKRWEQMLKDRGLNFSEDKPLPLDVMQQFTEESNGEVNIDNE